MAPLPHLLGRKWSISHFAFERAYTLYTMTFRALPLVDLVINVGIDYAIFMLLRCRHISLLHKVR